MWTPAQLAPYAWFRSDLGVSLVSGAVAAWADQSGNTRDFTQDTAPNRLGYSTSAAAFGNRPALVGTGSGWLDAVATWNLSQPLTIYLVGTGGTYADWRTFFDCPVTASRVAVRADPSSVLATYAQGSANLLGGSVSGPSVIATVFDGASSAHYVSNTSASVTGSATSPGTSSIGTPRIGAGPTAAYPLRPVSMLCELVVLAGADDSAKRAQMFRYFRARYGLAITGL